MAVRKLTETGIAKLKPPASGRLDIADAVMTGLALRVMPSGVKSWCFIYRFGGKQRRMTIGRYPEIDLMKARQIVRKGKENIALGDDPFTMREEKIFAQMSKAEEEITVQKLYEDFFELYAEKYHKRPKDTKRWFERHILPALGDKPIKEVRRRDVVKLIDGIKASKRPSGANHVLAQLRKMFNWAIERDLLESNVCSHISKPVPIKGRERVFTRQEIKQFWNACNALDYPYGPLCQILLLTGQRCNEIAKIKKAYIDFEEKIIRLPAENVKAGRTQDIPLSDFAISILKSLPQFKGPFIFTTTHGKKAVAGFGKTKSKIKKHFKAEDWRYHDLRRCCATGMAELGVPLHTISRVLGHAEGGVTRIYARHSYLPEKRKALDLWAAHVWNIVHKDNQPDNVISIRGRDDEKDTEKENGTEETTQTACSTALLHRFERDSEVRHS